MTAAAHQAGYPFAATGISASSTAWDSGRNNMQGMMLFNIGDAQMTVGELTLRAATLRNVGSPPC
jgi:hypothetical protein